jgi:hypothetical protein
MMEYQKKRGACKKWNNRFLHFFSFFELNYEKCSYSRSTWNFHLKCVLKDAQGLRGSIFHQTMKWKWEKKKLWKKAFACRKWENRFCCMSQLTFWPFFDSSMSRDHRFKGTWEVKSRCNLLPERFAWLNLKEFSWKWFVQEIIDQIGTLQKVREPVVKIIIIFLTCRKKIVQNWKSSTTTWQFFRFWLHFYDCNVPCRYRWKLILTYVDMLNFYFKEGLECETTFKRKIEALWMYSWKLLFILVRQDRARSKKVKYFLDFKKHPYLCFWVFGLNMSDPLMPNSHWV